MLNAKLSRLMLSLGIALGLTATLGAALVSSPARAQSPASVFISDLPGNMQPGAGSPGSLRWLAPGADLGRYGKVMLTPLTLYVSPDSKEKGLDTDAMKSLAEVFRACVIDKLEPAYPVVDKAGPGVLVLRPALTNVVLEKKRRGLLGFTPVGLLVNAARDEHAAHFSLKRAALEVELLDGVSGERVAIVIDQAPEKALSSGDSLDWSALEKTLGYYAQNLSKRLDAARGN